MSRAGNRGARSRSMAKPGTITRTVGTDTMCRITKTGTQKCIRGQKRVTCVHGSAARGFRSNDYICMVVYTVYIPCVCVRACVCVYVRVRACVYIRMHVYICIIRSSLHDKRHFRPVCFMFTRILIKGTSTRNNRAKRGRSRYSDGFFIIHPTGNVRSSSRSVGSIARFETIATYI